MKDAMTRLTETVTFIKGQKANSPLTGAEFDEITAALDQWSAATGLATKKTLSDLMTQTDATNKVDKTGRHFARATILLRCALVEPQPQWAAIAVSTKKTTDTRSLFNFALDGARDAAFSRKTAVDQMLADLRAQPLQILGRYKFNVDGGNQNGNPLTYNVWMENGTYKFSCGGLGMNAKATVQAVNVRATAYASIANAPGNIQAVDTANGAGADLILTTQFTGCSFCFMKSANGQNMRAAHIDPGKGAGAPTGVELSQNMRANADFANGNGGQMKVYGRIPNKSSLFGYPEAAGQMIIVGVRQGTEWKLFSQIWKTDGTLTAQRIDV